MGYIQQTIKGISWTGGFRIASRGIAFLRIFILARLLTPEQFGLFAIASLVITFLDVFTETGINIFLIQKTNDAHKFINAAWIISIIRGICMMLLIIISAPLITLFFHTPDILLLLLIASLVPFIKGFINPSVIFFQKDLYFHKEFSYRLTIFIIESFVTIVLALLTHHAISLIGGLVIGAISEVLLSFVLLHPKPSLIYEIEKIKAIVHHGKWVTFYGICNFIAQEADTVIVGKLLGPGSLGIYQMGYKIATLPVSEISDATNRVIFPVYAKIAQDRDRLRRAFIKTLQVVVPTVLLLSIVLFLLPEWIYVFFLGKEWAPVTNIIKILVVYGAFRAITGIGTSVLLSLQRQRDVALVVFLRVLTVVLFIIPFTVSFGLVGTVLAVLLSVVVEVPVMSYYVTRILIQKK